MPERKREKGKVGRGVEGKMERVCAEQRRRRGLAANVQPVDHRDNMAMTTAGVGQVLLLHPPPQPRGRLLAKMAPAAIFLHRF